MHEVYYGLPLENINEVLRMVAITKVPKSPSWLTGVINVRGQITPVIDLRDRLGLPVCTPGLNTPIVIIQSKKRIVGLIIDQTGDVTSLPSQLISPPDQLTKKAKPVKAFCQLDDHPVIILDIQRLASGTEKYAMEGILKNEQQNASPTV